jgi:AcrR family transcriptional regulator
MVTAGSTKPAGLRERKKQRTRERIVEVATALFAEQGYEETTLLEVAEAAEVALSTIFNYFPGKPDIVFAVTDVVIESAHKRIVQRPDGESATEAILAWVSDVLPAVERPYAEAIRRVPRIVGADPKLQAEERLRLALLEDALATGFAGELGESADGMRARVMAAIALGGMIDVWKSWYELHASDAEFDLADLCDAKAEYLARALEAGRRAVDALPSP